jgi:hypothetical protein
MKKVFRLLSALAIIVGFLCFLAALYVGVDPNSSLSDRLRTVPALKLILKGRETYSPTIASPYNGKGRIIYKYIQNPSGKGSTVAFYDTELLLPDTDLFSQPSENAKLNEKTADVKRYRVLERKNDWALILFQGKKRWVSPKRKNLLYYNMTEEMRRIISGEGDYLDFPLSSWYDEMVGSKVRDILSQNKDFHKYETAVGIFYCDDMCVNSINSAFSIIEQLRKRYSDFFRTRIELKPDVILPNIFLKSGKGGKAYLLKGDYVLGILNVDNFAINSDTSIAVLLHEYTHHLNRVVLRLGSSVPAPVWVNEGLCDYFSAKVVNEFLQEPANEARMDRKISDIDKVDIVPGMGFCRVRSIIANKPFLKLKSRHTRMMFENGDNIQFNKLSNDEFWKKRGLFSSDTNKLYSSAWATVAWLIEGNGGKNQDGFLNYLEALIKDEKKDVSLFDFLDIKTSDELDGRIKDDVLSGSIINY